MTDKRKGDELTEEELEAQIGAALPDREVMSILPWPDPTGGVPLPIPHHPLDPQYDPQEEDAGGTEST